MTTSPKQKAAKTEKKDILVRVVHPQRGKLADRLEVNARVEAFEQAGILPRVEGVVTKIHRYEGEKVKTGDLLATIENDEQVIDRDSAKLTAEQAALGVRLAELALEEAKALQAGEKITLDNENTKYTRAKEQHARTIIADQDLEAAKYAHDSAYSKHSQSLLAERKLVEDLKVKKLQYKDAESKVKQAELKLSWTEIRATLDGTITARNVKLGQRSMTGQAAFQLDDLDSLIVYASVPEKELRNLRVGLAVTLGCTSYPRQNFEGRVEFIAPKINIEGGKVTARIRLMAQSDPPLLPGMFVSGHIITEERNDILLLPKKALLFDRDRPYIYIVERSEDETKARQVYLQRGLENADSVEYLPLTGKSAEIDENSEVVLVGVDRLFDGAVVRLEGESKAKLASDNDHEKSDEE